MMTHADYREEVEAVGVSHFDLFEHFSVEGADTESKPRPARYLTFAAVYGVAVAQLVSELGATLVLYDTSAAIGLAVALELDIPHVNVCAGHDGEPGRLKALLATELPCHASPAFLAALPQLHTYLGREDLSTLDFISLQSPYLNLYCEPQQFISEDTLASFSPIEFIGSQSTAEMATKRSNATPIFSNLPGRKIYLSFGTVVFHHFRELAQQAMETIVATLADLPDVSIMVSLGEHPASAREVSCLMRPNVRVESYVDQLAVLAEADLFITHCGLNSTHEAISHNVPMIAYPFFGDQPGLASRCVELGLAVPLVERPRRPVTGNDILRALDEIDNNYAEIQQRLAQAQEWERDVIRDRGRVAERIIDLARNGTDNLTRGHALAGK